MDLLLSTYVFFVGAAFGSFALVLADRMHSNKNWVKGRSRCDNCDKVLNPRDLVPVFSWISSKGKCRHCGVKLSVFYPATEIFTGIAFLLSYLNWPYGLGELYSIVLFVLWSLSLVIMAALFVYDLRWFKLPNKLVYPLFYFSLVWALIVSLNDTEASFVAISIAYFFSLLVSAGFFLALYLYSKGKWIGDGDVRIGVAIGFFTGSFLGSWLVILIASVAGVVFSLPELINSKSTKDKKLKMKVPFGPMLIIGLFIVVVFGESIINWYKSTILLL